MLSILRLVLIAVVAMPHGWCCVLDVEVCCVSSRLESSSPGNCFCACCKQLELETCHPDSKSDPAGRVPKSCRCQCRFLIAVPNSEPRVVVTAMESVVRELFTLKSQFQSQALCLRFLSFQLLVFRFSIVVGNADSRGF